MPKALDITNQRFGKLVAIKKVASKSGKTYWLCKCDCGNEKEIQTSHLTSGATTSCGECFGKKALQKANIEKKCILCGKIFLANTYNRQYCYECSPEGLSSAEALKSKKRALKNFLIEYKGGKCQECGYDKCQGALQFHHKNPENKEFSLAHVNLNNTNFSMKKVIEEIDKCDLLCANCHAEKHYSNE